MIINKDLYECKDCKRISGYDTSKPYEKVCEKCGSSNITFIDNLDCDMDKELPPPYDPTKDPNSQFYKPIIKCPTCGSANVNKISGTERAVSVIGLGLFSKKINKSFKCKSCGYTW